MVEAVAERGAGEVPERVRKRKNRRERVSRRHSDKKLLRLTRASQPLHESLMVDGACLSAAP